MANKNDRLMFVDASVLGFKKDVGFVDSNRNFMAAQNLQLTLIEAEETENKTYEEVISAGYNAVSAEIDFITNVLKLNDRQVETLLDLPRDEAETLAMSIVSKLMHWDLVIEQARLAEELEAEAQAEEDEDTVEEDT